MDWQGWNIILVAGQSNAEGVYPVIPQQTTSPFVDVFGVDYAWHTAEEPCANQGAENCVVDKVNFNRMAGYGATKRIGLALRALRPEMKIGLVNVARGGTSIRDWQKPANGLDDTTLYGAMIKRARAASTRGTLSGLVWAQGEGDALPANAETAKIYDQLLIQLVADVRSDLGNLAVVIAGLGHNTHADMADFPNWLLVDGKLEAAQRQIQNSAFFPMRDVTLTHNLVHYNVSGHNTLANRAAAALSGLMIS